MLRVGLSGANDGTVDKVFKALQNNSTINNIFNVRFLSFSRKDFFNRITKNKKIKKGIESIMLNNLDERGFYSKSIDVNSMLSAWYFFKKVEVSCSVTDVEDNCHLLIENRTVLDSVIDNHDWETRSKIISWLPIVLSMINYDVIFVFGTNNKKHKQDYYRLMQLFKRYKDKDNYKIIGYPSLSNFDDVIEQIVNFIIELRDIRDEVPR